MRVLIAPDSFKGSLSAADVAQAIATGWTASRPQDDVQQHPMADGGEGTLDAIIGARPDGRRHTLCGARGPNDDPVDVDWISFPDGVVVVELAAACGLTLLPAPAPMTAHTFALGQVIRHALAAAPRCLYIGLGGSGSTDGGTGALTALGARFTDILGRPVRLGGGSLREIRAADLRQLVPPPPRVILLSDVHSPLLGGRGAAATYGPQKGATRAQVQELEQGLANFAQRMPGKPDTPGSGAAGGTAYGFATAWKAHIATGFDLILAVTNLDNEIRRADLIITGEGRFDAGSWDGKVAGSVARAAAEQRVPVCVIAGTIESEAIRNPPVPIRDALDLISAVGSLRRAMALPEKSIVAAASALASSFRG